MKPLFTIHEGEFLVGDHITRKFGRKYDVWVPTKDKGVDLLVTRKKRGGKAVRLQVKFSRGFGDPKRMGRQFNASSWYKLDPIKIRKSHADLWVFAILTLRHEAHFVVIPKRELQRRIPREASGIWHLYLSVFDSRCCYETRTLGKRARLDLHLRGVRDRRLDFSEYLENWTLLEKFSKGTR